MPQDIRLLADWVTADSWPHVACPVCGEGYVAIEKVHDHQTARSQSWRDNENWEPDWIHGFFTGTLQCALPNCREIVAVSGEFRVDADTAPNGAWYGDYSSFYKLQYAVPSLPLLTFPDDTPEKVNEAVQQAAAVLWADPGAAANRLRMGIENLLTAKGVPRTSINKRRKRERLGAHQRIERLKQSHQEAGEALMAVKWIGNEGSHEDGELSVLDVIDGAEFLEHALALIYDHKKKALLRRVKAVNKAKGVPKKNS